MTTIIFVCGIVASFLLIYGLKQMSSPLTAVRGIVVAGYGMLVVVLASFLYAFGIEADAEANLVVNLTLVLLAIAIGAGWAWWTGRRVALTKMPQMTALFNGMGGGSAAAIAASELFGTSSHGVVSMTVVMVGALIGSVALSGSIIAWAKLDGRMRKPWRVKGQSVLNSALFLVLIVLGAYLVFVTQNTAAGVIFFVLALALGVTVTAPIGGADMPVIIALFNALTGLAVALDGYVLQNAALMIAGMVVGSSGLLLTVVMAKAMNRSITNVLFSNFGDAAIEQQGDIQGEMKPVEASDAATTMRYADKVIIAPGYGLAAAQAQQKLYEFVQLLQAADVEVKFAIHPVAGRMPGHMDVLLAEAGVPYDLLFDLDEINEEFKTADVALVIGANDVVNPAARTNKASPIYGMSILNVDQAKQVYVIKRGQGRGYAGIENELFYADNCNMVYGDAKDVIGQMVQAIKPLVASDKAA
ncbi:NAD(P)(+) transhydrogenase (Re/Si-specific) subunit beta [Rhodobacteraceae bacterium KMM 6894]|nr:NAD(P)(+) transhydrogenase (Re/Si-specific) subunit beta [Rhodobacteraceae bacterium KMM 6894]